jgi:heterodisulfide reductase subunit A-like polyferredoxin
LGSITNPIAERASAAHVPVGAVMVVGGGIAGMQASLDLAEQGFKVYLVEAKTAIGGKMAQLDKTFPTNDCAMCTISPKLVESGRHPNIEILTGTTVEELSGTPGDFTVRVLRRPRYIDPVKCTACGDCADVCPVIVPDRFNEGLADRRAAYKLYPQAVPNAYAIDKRGIAPCRDACPAGQRAQGYIALIREGRWDDALRVIKMDNPFPGICGRICNHRCETACNRGLVDEPINIHALKRLVTEKVYSKPRPAVEPAEIKYPNQRVAIIGAGPCGLTAAQDVIREGYPVTIFEAMPVAGGMLRVGVPEFRLPTTIIEREVQDIVDLGIDLRLGHCVENLDEVFAEGFTAVLISVGAHEGVRLPIPGSNLDGVLINTRFLRDVRLGKYTRDENGVLRSDGAPMLGRRVLVLGGGNVAIDVARTAVRLGAQVSMACLESREKMPAHAWEIDAAIEEGITLYTDRTFERVNGDENQHASGVECMQVESFAFDETGRLQVTKVPGSNHVIPCDTVIFSVGQRAGLAFIPDDAGVGLTERKTIAINPNTFAATRPGVFAAGDSVSGTAFVVEAVASGHKAAASILRHLRGEGLEPPARPPLPVVNLTAEEISERMARGEIKRQPRVPLPQLGLQDRLLSFAEVEGGYSESSGQEEAARCLACGICSECMSCTFACGVKAIDHDMAPQVEELKVGAVILAPGYEAYHAELSEEFGFGRYPNVVTALQFERLLSASGPTLGHVRRPSDQKTPHRIAFLQCIGSRDTKHDYCSAVCCMYATKEATIAKEHQPELDVHVFMMDMRAFSKGYAAYFDRARERYGVHYHRCRISALREDPETHDLVVNYCDETGGMHLESFDLVVLSVGMEISESVRELGKRLGVELDEYGFCHTALFDPLQTSRPGIFAVGPFRTPKDIPESVTEASGAAAAAASQLSRSRFTLTSCREFPPERDVSQEEPRIGVFICSCGSNIGGFVDVAAVSDYARTLPRVGLAEFNLYTCSQDSIRHITEQMGKHNLNRLVVASCTPLTHQPLFQESVRAAGLNPYLFEMANIRNQCSWVHSQERERATAKAKDLVRMAVARAGSLEQLHTVDVPVKRAALVVGGGPAGMTAALSLANQGFPVHLVEQEGELGGNLRRVYTPCEGLDPQVLMRRLVEGVQANENITVHLASRVVASTGFMGGFTSTIRNGQRAPVEVNHGTTILATGAAEYRGSDYGYGSDPRIVTQQEFEKLLAGWESRYSARNGDASTIDCEDGPSRQDACAPSAVRMPAPPPGVPAGPLTFAMIQCVGPAERFCSRICCTVALKNALRLKEICPEARVVILYRDIRTYGFRERLYTEARRRGVIFLRYDPERKPEVALTKAGVTVESWDPAIKRTVRLVLDWLVLSMPVVPHESSKDLAGLFRVARDADGFFLEAHVKLRPVDFATDGIFMAGMAHYPKLLDETIIQAQAAAARAARVLSRDVLTAGGRVANVDAALCTGCLTCVRICPFNVPRIRPDLAGAGQIQGAAYIEPSVCRGCGSCAAECPARAIQLSHYTDVQMAAKVEALFEDYHGLSRTTTD